MCSHDDRPYIGFSHRYEKLQGQTSAELVCIRPVVVGPGTSPDLIEYDTLYFEWVGGYARDPVAVRRHFKLDPGRYLQLVFVGDKGIPFCSIRRPGDHWRGNVGDIFEIRIKNP
jgi:hypothetical protein